MYEKAYEISRENYVEKYEPVLFQKYGVDAGRIWDTYHARVEFALDLIPRFRIGDEKATQKYIRIAFGVSNEDWDAMVFTFDRLKEALNSDRAYTKFKSEIALLKGIDASEYKNAKMIEMMLKLYNDDYQKSNEQKIEVPDKIIFSFLDTSETDENLDKHIEDLKRKE